MLRQRAWESPTPFAYLTLEPDLCGMLKRKRRAEPAQRGDEVDPFGLKVSSIVQQGNPLIEIRFIKFNLTSRAYQTKSSPLEGLARPRALPRPPPYGAVERSARAWSPALQAGPVLIF